METSAEAGKCGKLHHATQKQIGPTGKVHIPLPQLTFRSKLSDDSAAFMAEVFS
jgi:hypothetical protein